MPLAYALAMGFSFTVMYLSAAVAFIVCASWCGSFTVNAQRRAAGNRHVVLPSRRNRRDTLLSACHLHVNVGNQQPVYHNMPLFIITSCIFRKKLAGMMMAPPPGIEIPTMLIAGYFAKRL